MRSGLCLLAALQFFTGSALAEPLLTSVRPMPRPQTAIAAESTATSARPRQRPRDLQSAPRVSDPVLVSAPAAKASKPSTTRKGSVCNDPNINGVVLKPITSRVKGCNVKAPVQVTSVDGVRLNPPATINCDAAVALAEWVNEGLQPAFHDQVAQLNIANSYACRPRNNVRGNKVSEHGSGNAIDISGFVLNTGKTMSVASNYGSQIKKAKKAACGIFFTTLGPGSDGYHEDHIHLDVAQYRGNPYCH